MTDPFAPPSGDQPQRPSEWYQKPVRSRRTEILLKVLAGVAVVTVLGFAAAAVLVVWAISSYGSNK